MARDDELSYRAHATQFTVDPKSWPGPNLRIEEPAAGATGSGAFAAENAVQKPSLSKAHRKGLALGAVAIGAVGVGATALVSPIMPIIAMAVAGVFFLVADIRHPQD